MSLRDCLPRRNRNAATWKLVARATVNHERDLRRIGPKAANEVFMQEIHKALLLPPEDALLREALHAVVNRNLSAGARAMALDVAGDRLGQLRSNGWRSCDVF